jgi:serine/threonine protein kinase
MPAVYPCTFEQASPKPLEEILHHLPEGCLRKVRTLSEAIHGKVTLVESCLGNQPKSFVVKQIPRAKMKSASGIECPRNEIFASLAISKGLRVPCVAKTFFAAQDRKNFYLASEYCSNGELLSAVTQAGRLQGDAILREVLTQILTCVQGLHEAGVAHRDLSLENILIASDGNLRLIDFAQAIMVHSRGDPQGEVHVSLENGLPGKPRYRGPELATGAPYLATKVDSFAIGVMLYALVAGTYPFMPNAATSEIAGLVDLFPVDQASHHRCIRLRLQLQKAGKYILEEVSPGCLDMMEQLLAPNPNLRLSVKQALAHPWLTGSAPGLWPASHDEDNDEEVSTSCSCDFDSTTDCSELNGFFFDEHAD